MDEEDLAATIYLAQDRFADKRVVPVRMKVRIGRRSCGGVSITLMSRTLTSAMCRVRGIGVAVRVRTSTSVRSCFRRSLCATPKRCSSSMISRPRLGK